jgi:hypothetical protein
MLLGIGLSRVSEPWIFFAAVRSHYDMIPFMRCFTLDLCRTQKLFLSSNHNLTAFFKV